jgi:hypothetical protein
MRKNLTIRLDAVGLHTAMGLDSTDRLFRDRADLLHTTSAIRFPVFKDGTNYSGYTPRMTRHPLLRRFINEYLVPEIGQFPSALFVPSRPRYYCSSYLNAQGGACHHNWVQRDICVWYAINAIRSQIEDSVGHRDALAHAIRAELKASQESRPATVPLAEVGANLAEVQGRMKAALHAKLKAAPGVERKTADEVYGEILDEARALERQCAQIEGQSAMKSIDLDAEVEKTLAILDDLHLFLARGRAEQAIA